MPGFRITNIDTDIKLYDFCSEKLKHDTLRFEKWRIDRATLYKFENDKVFLENEQLIVILDGVVLNSYELMIEYGKKTWLDTVLIMVENGNSTWFSRLVGPVSGAVYYKLEDKWVIFTGPLGEKALFYWSDGRDTIIGSQLEYLTEVMKQSDISVEPDETALCHLMAYNSYIDNETCIRGIKRIYPGDYIIYTKGYFEELSYIKYDFKQDKGSEILPETEYINKLDEAFIHSFRRIIDKNDEYGYKTLIDLSGGYDSRMNVYTAKRLNVRDVLVDCYAQSGSHDASMSQKISTELGYKYLFMSLDNAESLFGVDDNVRMLSGTAGYAGITGGRDMLQLLSGGNVGLEVTGLLGDVHDGSMVTTYSDGDIDTNAYRESTTLIEKEDYVFPLTAKERFKHHLNEHFWFYNRGMICGMTSFLIRQNFTEAVTPFGDPEFLEAYLTIPWEMRVKGGLLRKWLAVKYPDAAKYTNSRTGMTLKMETMPGANIIRKIGKQKIKVDRLISHKKGKPYGMNDMGFWYDNNPVFHKYVDKCVEARPSNIDNYDRISNAWDKLNKSGTITDKLMLMTVNSIFRIFID